jgi:hypothetical protein
MGKVDKPAITAEQVWALLDYEPSTGVFTRRVRTASRHQVGDRADFVVTGGRLRGYSRVSLMSQRFLAHRVAWLYMHGEWPSMEIDHINGDKSDNRIANLRNVSPGINSENRRKPRVDSKTGILGVQAHQGKWATRVQVSGQSIYIGVFDTPEQAHVAYVEAKRKHHKGCTL